MGGGRSQLQDKDSFNPKKMILNTLMLLFLFAQKCLKNQNSPCSNVIEINQNKRKNMQIFVKLSHNTFANCIPS